MCRICYLCAYAASIFFRQLRSPISWVMLSVLSALFDFFSNGVPCPSG